MLKTRILKVKYIQYLPVKIYIKKFNKQKTLLDSFYKPITGYKAFRTLPAIPATETI